MSRRRNTTLVAMVAVLAVVCSGCDWLGWGGGIARNGTALEGGFTTSSATALVPSTIFDAAPTAQIVTGKGLLFVTRDGTLTALDQQSGGVVWAGALPTGSTAGTVPFVDKASNTVFLVAAGATHPVLVGFDIDGVRNCNPIWFRCQPVFQATLGTTVAPATPPVVDGGRVFANGADRLYAFDAAGHTSCTTTSAMSTCSPLWSGVTGAVATGVGPSTSGGVVFDAARSGSTGRLAAFDEGSGNIAWTGTLPTAFATAAPSIDGNGSVYVPAGDRIVQFAASGCTTPPCAPQHTLTLPASDADGAFLAPAVLDGSNAFATNANGSMYEWDVAGCSATTCAAAKGAAVNDAGGPAYSQAAVSVNGLLFVSARRVVSGTAHVAAIALAESDLHVVRSWDLGPAAPGAALASVSMAWSVVYVPTTAKLVALHAPPVRPLAALSVSPLSLSPAFAPSTYDYVVQCASGANALTVDITAAPGGTVQLTSPVTTSPSASQSDSVSVAENQAIVINATDAHGASTEYWIRCLPHDFPPLTVGHPSAGSPTPGWYLLSGTVVPASTSPYAMILDTNGTPVWYRKTRDQSSVNLSSLGHDQVADFESANVGFGIDPSGHYTAYNLDTGTSTNISAVGSPTDLHELYTRPNGNHLLLSYAVKTGVDLTGVKGTPTPGPNSSMYDCLIQEVDPSGKLVWQWRASDHIDPRTETTETVGLQNGAYDVFHCNSIDVNRNGNILVSLRHANAVYEIRRSDGKLLWKMGGTPTNKDGATIISITNDSYGGISEQHDARYLPNGDISVFDDQTTPLLPARAVEFAINFTAHTAQPVFSSVSPVSAASCCLGSFRLDPDGHDVIGWGRPLPFGGLTMSELDASGNDVLDITMVGGGSYRAIKVPSNRYDINVLRDSAGQ